MKAGELSCIIRSERDALAEEIVARQYELQPKVWQPFGSQGRAKSVRDAGYHLSYLAEALSASDPLLLAEYAAWVKVLFAGLEFPEDVLTTTLTCTGEVLKRRAGPEYHDIVERYLDRAQRALQETASTPPSHVDASAPQGKLARQYLAALLDGRRNAASQMILGAVEDGTPVKEIYLHVFQPVQREIGRLWQTNRISVAQEHYCTAATQMVMSQLYPRVFSADRIGYRLVATCVGGELHEIGVRMVADFFEMAGWDTYYLGANTPTESVLRTIEDRAPDVLGVSATITMHVSHLTDLIKQVRAAGVGNGLKILVGGYPFNASPDLWRQVGADGYAPNAEAATTLANQWMRGR